MSFLEISFKTLLIFICLPLDKARDVVVRIITMGEKVYETYRYNLIIMIQLTNVHLRVSCLLSFFMKNVSSLIKGGGTELSSQDCSL